MKVYVKVFSSSKGEVRVCYNWWITCPTIILNEHVYIYHKASIRHCCNQSAVTSAWDVPPSLLSAGSWLVSLSLSSTVSSCSGSSLGPLSHTEVSYWGYSDMVSEVLVTFNTSWAISFCWYLVRLPGTPVNHREDTSQQAQKTVRHKNLVWDQSTRCIRTYAYNHLGYTTHPGYTISQINTYMYSRETAICSVSIMYTRHEECNMATIFDIWHL